MTSGLHPQWCPMFAHVCMDAMVACAYKMTLHISGLSAPAHIQTQDYARIQVLKKSIGHKRDPLLCSINTQLITY